MPAYIGFFGRIEVGSPSDRNVMETDNLLAAGLSDIEALAPNVLN